MTSGTAPVNNLDQRGYSRPGAGATSCSIGAFEADLPDNVCGDGIVGGGEACDDGDTAFESGQYCGPACQRVPCGQPTNSEGALPKSSDALFALRAAVGNVICDKRVCDINGNGAITSSDALTILRAAVGLQVAMNCPVAPM